ncbi:MAG TPA: hypothetical protein VLT13_02845, partial [Bacteroidota bacterium]|nr:hypothetical protein [Bacteroidota bacterium]
LLPFYVAGTLNAEQQTAVEQALGTSEELRTELRFWQRAEAVVHARGEMTAAGHLSSRDLVDRAMGAMPGERLLVIDQHLQSCRLCAEEFSLVKQSVGQVATAPRQVPQWSVAAALRWIRPLYVVPVAVAALAVVVLLFRSPEEQLQPPATPALPSPPVVKAPEPEGETALFALTYRPEMRSASRYDTAVMTLAPDHDSVRLVVAVPRNTAVGIQYRFTVESRAAGRHRVNGLVQRYASGEVYDSLQCIIPRTILPASDGTVTLVVSEVLPPSLKDLSPEEYRLPFDLRLPNK